MKKLAFGFIGVLAVLLTSAGPGHAGDRFRGGVGGGGHFSGHFGVRHHVFAGPRFFVGPRVFIGPPAYWYPYPYYVPPVVVEPPPPVAYAEPPPPQQYWYYCQDPQGYYPYVPQCPGGWLQVVPRPNP